MTQSLTFTLISTIMSVATFGLSTFIFLNQKKTNKKLSDLNIENLIQNIELNKINLEKEKEINIDIKKRKFSNTSDIIEFKNIGSATIQDINLVFEKDFEPLIFEKPQYPKEFKSGQSFSIKYAASDSSPDQTKIKIYWIPLNTSEIKTDTKIINV